jgi:hypothetical protein
MVGKNWESIPVGKKEEEALCLVGTQQRLLLQ